MVLQHDATIPITHSITGRATLSPAQKEEYFNALVFLVGDVRELRPFLVAYWWPYYSCKHTRSPTQTHSGRATLSKAQEEEYFNAWTLQPHHPTHEQLWQKLREEAKMDVVGAGRV